MNQKINVVILAAGLGTRMKSRRAKVLHETAGDTLLNHILRAALQVARPEDITVVVGHQADEVRNSVKTAGIRFAEQREQKGTGHALLCARGVIAAQEGILLVLNGDGPLLKPKTLETLIGTQKRNGHAATIVTTKVTDPAGYGRIVRDQRGMVAAIVEQKAATPDQLAIPEINPGLYCFDANKFWAHVDEISPNNSANEYYLTEMIEILRRHGFTVAPLPVADETELLGINTRVELAAAGKLLRARKAEELMLAGVTIEDPESVAIDVDVQAGPDTIVEANVQLRGKTRVGAGLPNRCRVYPARLRHRRWRDNSSLCGRGGKRHWQERDGWTICPSANECSRGRIGSHRQFRRTQEDAPRENVQGESSRVSRRLGDRLRSEYRRRYHHLQLRWNTEASHANCRRRICWKQFDLGSASEN